MPEIDLSRPWRISHELEGHTEDVKALSAICARNSDGDDRLEAFVDASRDQTGNFWYRSKPDPTPGNRPPSRWLKGPSFRGQRFQNSVATYDDGQERSLGLLMMGGLDARILVFRLPDLHTDDGVVGETPFQILQDHYDNVCDLRVSNKSSDGTQSSTLLISASWDCTSRVWRLRPDAKHGSLWRPHHLLKGHTAAAWAAEIVDCKAGQERYLTASADYFVRLWNGEQLTKIFSGHTDVARGIKILSPIPSTDSDRTTSGLVPFFDREELFATISNDGTTRVWSLDSRRWPTGNSGSGGEPLRILQLTDGTGDILYDVDIAGKERNTDHRLLVTAGEGGRINFWDADTAKCVSSIDQPVTSAWSVLALPLSGDIVTADSDGKVRVYTQRVYNTSFMAQELRLEVRARGGHIELDKNEIAEHERRCSVISQRRIRRNVNGIQVDLTTSEDHTSKHQSASDNIFEGRKYDCLLSIDVSDDSAPLTLPVNRGDDARMKAKEFIEKHTLSTKYEDEIVSFIERFGPL